jgi:secreted trypsin-like serine protease
MNKLLFTLIATVIALLNTSAVFAITNGGLDGDEHPAVVLILMEQDGVPAYRCSGVLLSPKYVLTAGHCTGAPGEFSGLRIFTESDVENGNNSYPFAGRNSVEAVRWAAHPDYPNELFIFNDVGVIELAKGVKLPKGKEYASLPVVNILDDLARQRGLQDVTFTAVGYGLQEINPVFVESERVRMFSTPHLIQINVPGFVGDFSLLLSNNHATGGTCFGDSGGPNFIGDSLVVGGVTSFGLNGNCAGTGGVFRIDRQNVLDFINNFMNQ